MIRRTDAGLSTNSSDLDHTADTQTPAAGEPAPVPVDVEPAASTPRSLGEIAARGTGVTLATQALRFVIQLASLVALARVLLPVDFGVVAEVTAITGIAELIRDFGLSSAAVQAKVISDAQRSNLFWVNVGIGSACCVAAIATSPLVERLYGDARLPSIMIVLSSVFVIGGANTQFRAELSRGLRFRALSLIDVAAQAIGVAVAIGLAVAGAGYWAIVIQQVVAAAATLLLNVRVCRWSPGRPDLSASIGQFFRFGGGVFGTQVISYITRNIDNVAIGVAYGAVPLGLYSRAYQLLLTPLNQINAPIARVALPVLAQMKDDRQYSEFIQKAQIVSCYLTATVFAMCAALAGPLVYLAFGPSWSGVAPLFAYLCLGGIFRAISQISYWIYLSKHLPGAQLKMYLVTRPGMVAIILAGLPWGPVGVAIGCSIAYFLFWIVSLWDASRVAGLDTPLLFGNALRSIVLVSLPCGLLSLLSVHLVHEPVIQLLFAAVMSLLYVVVAAALIKPVRRDTMMLLSFGKRAVSGRPGSRRSHVVPAS